MLIMLMSGAFVSPVHSKSFSVRGQRKRNLCPIVCVQERTPSGFGKSLVKSLSEPKIDSNSEKFSAWAVSKGLQLSSLKVALFPDSLRGMLVTERIERGQALISVRPSFALEVNNLRSRSPFPNEVPDTVWNAVPWFARLAVKLLLKREDKDWKPWISALPKSIDTPLHWEDEELDELQSKRLKKSILAQRVVYREMFDKLEMKSSFMKSIRYEDFELAMDIAISRAFQGPLEVASFKERVRLFLFVGAVTMGSPLLGILDWNRAINGKCFSIHGFLLGLT